MTNVSRFYFCSVGLDPDEPDGPDLKVLNGLKSFLAGDLSNTEREHFFGVTLPVIVKSALQLKSLKPVNGLPFSLQQEGVYYIHESQTIMNSTLAGRQRDFVSDQRG